MPDSIAELRPRPRERVVVILTGGRSFTVPGERAQALSIGLELTDEDIGQLDQIDQYFRGRDKAHRLIALRDRTRAQVKTALIGLGIEAQICDGIIGELEEQRLIDDVRYAREFVRTRSEVRLMGPHRLRRDLARLGVARSIVDEAIAQEIDGDTQEAQARSLVERKLANSIVDEKAVRRMAGLLRRKGYDYEIVNRIAYELLSRVGSENAVED